MKRWQYFAGNSGSAITSWNCDTCRGFLAGKRRSDSQGPDGPDAIGGPDGRGGARTPPRSPSRRGQRGVVQIQPV
jgi:hypothetical protein